MNRFIAWLQRGAEIPNGILLLSVLAHALAITAIVVLVVGN